MIWHEIHRRREAGGDIHRYPAPAAVFQKARTPYRLRTAE
jgi:hypothetical protein